VQEGRAPRRVTFVNAKVRTDGDWQDVQIGNVSATGLMIRMADPPDVGETVEVRHRGWGVIGEVVWRSRSRAGVRSFDKIDEEGLLATSGIGRQESAAIHDLPAPSFWRRLRGR
jgi:hypothetical protein